LAYQAKKRQIAALPVQAFGATHRLLFLHMNSEFVRAVMVPSGVTVCLLPFINT
jgi:hypothetical protein